MAVAMLGESSRHLRSLRHFSYAGSRNFAALGLGELQVGAEKVIILEKVPLSNLPWPKKRGAFWGKWPLDVLSLRCGGDCGRSYIVEEAYCLCVQFVDCTILMEYFLCRVQAR